MVKTNIKHVDDDEQHPYIPDHHKKKNQHRTTNNSMNFSKLAILKLLFPSSGGGGIGIAFASSLESSSNYILGSKQDDGPMNNNVEVCLLP